MFLRTIAFSLLYIFLIHLTTTVYCGYGVYETLYWNDYCNRTIEIPCSGGQLAIRQESDRDQSLWEDNCYINVTLDLEDRSCFAAGSNQAIYFSVKRAKLQDGCTVLIHDERDMVKNISGPLWGPASEIYPRQAVTPNVAQLLSAYRRKPQLTVHFSRDDVILTSATVHQNFTVDFLGLTKSSVVWRYSRCPALDGYMSEELLCDTSDHRINCPKTYDKSLYADNGVYFTHDCPRPHTASPIWYPTPRPSTGNNADGTIMAAMVISFAVFFLLVLVILYARHNRCCAHKHCERPLPPASSVHCSHPGSPFGNEVAFGQPVIANSTIATNTVLLSPKPFLDAPPSYDSVIAV